MATAKKVTVKAPAKKAKAPAKKAKAPDRMDRFTWHPDEIRIVKRNGKDIPPTKLSDLVAQEKAAAEAEKQAKKEAKKK